MRFHSVPVTLGLLTLLLAGCTSRTSTPASPAGLAGTRWRLEKLGDQPAIPGVEATMEFPEEGKVAGRGSCNRFFGTVEISGESIKFGPLASTKMACLDDATSTQETRYLEALAAAERFSFDGPALLIHSRGGGAPLRFRVASQ